MGTRGAWATAFLATLGNNGADENTVKLVSAWTKAENTKARYNPLATTLSYGRWTPFNSAGVKNYSTYQEGIEASVATLQGDFAGYPALLEALRGNDPERALLSGGLDTWGSHSGAVQGFYRISDTRDEELLSDGGSSNDVPVGATPPAVDPNAETQQQEADRNSQGPSVSIDNPFPSVNPDDIRNFAKILTGVLLIILAGGVVIIVAIKSYSPQAALIKAVTKVAT